MTLLSRVYIDKENRNNTLFEKKIKRLVVTSLIITQGRKKVVVFLPSFLYIRKSQPP